MDIPVTIASGTAFDADLGETGVMTIVFTTQANITYKTGTALYFHAVITEGANSQTVCFELTGGANPYVAGEKSFTIANTKDFTDAATATGKVYYTAA
ncbi:MAG: hypothetical protein ABT01_05540 [Clostridium sp. SCN 57-10]|nr:MAG: hypothetical protein ABT01_05540 [Clostridium sp. SCN 57-10]